MKTISSRQNIWFKRVKDALRDHADEIVIEGPKQVADAIAAGWKPVAVIAKGAHESADIGFTAALFDALAETKSPQNVIGLFRRPESRIPNPGSSILVALDAVQDPGNVGTIVRLAAAFDCAGVILLPGCADAYSPKAIRASAGAILSVPIVNAVEVTGDVYYADASGKLTEPPARGATIVFGSEGSGVSEAIRRRGKPIAIATSGKVESLNVAAAAAILLSKSYEARGERPSRPQSPRVPRGDD